MSPQYVVYLTFYSGNRLPPFYLGYTREGKILQGYHGTVKSKRYEEIWKRELRENPQLFRTFVLQRFETDTEALEREEYLQRFFDVPNNPMFINMGIGNGKFGASGENCPSFGVHRSHTVETKIKIGMASKGNSYSRGRHCSEETKQKRNAKLRRPHTFEWNLNISNSREGKLGKSQCPHCGKIGSELVMRRWHFDNCRVA